MKKQFIEVELTDNRGSSFIDIDSIISIADTTLGHCTICYLAGRQELYVTTHASAREVFRAIEALRGHDYEPKPV